MTFKRYALNLAMGVIVLPLAIVVFSLFFLFGLFLAMLLLIASLLHYPTSHKFYRHTKNLSIGLDQLGNASIGGNPDVTVSGRLGYIIYYKKQPKAIYVIICKILSLFFRQSRHCLEAVELDEVNT